MHSKNRILQCCLKFSSQIFILLQFLFYVHCLNCFKCPIKILHKKPNFYLYNGRMLYDFITFEQREIERECVWEATENSVKERFRIILQNTFTFIYLIEWCISIAKLNQTFSHQSITSYTIICSFVHLYAHLLILHATKIFRKNISSLFLVCFTNRNKFYRWNSLSVLPICHFTYINLRFPFKATSKLKMPKV